MKTSSAFVRMSPFFIARPFRTSRLLEAPRAINLGVRGGAPVVIARDADRDTSRIAMSRLRAGTPAMHGKVMKVGSGGLGVRQAETSTGTTAASPIGGPRRREAAANGAMRGGVFRGRSGKHFRNALGQLPQCGE